MIDTKEEIKRGPGRPSKDDKKVGAPHLTLRQETIEKMNEIANQRGKSQSEIYQEALDHYISIVERNRVVIRL